MDHVKRNTKENSKLVKLPKHPERLANPKGVDNRRAETSQKARTNAVQVTIKPGEDPNLVTARAAIGPHLTNANSIWRFARGTLGETIELASYVTALAEGAKRVNENDLKQVEATLFSQATALNVMFGELVNRAGINIAGGGQYLPAMEIYFRMALKAQNQCRMTLETLSNIKNPPVVYAKQANIASGPQQVNNGTMPRAHAKENQSPRNKLLEQGNEQRMDVGTESPTGNGHPPMEAMAEGDRTQVKGKQG